MDILLDKRRENLKYMSLTEALKLLPGVAPNNAKAQIRVAVEGDFLQEPTGQIGTVVYKAEELKELFVEDQSGMSEVIRITPEGAQTLIRLYNTEALKMKLGNKAGEPQQELLKYAASGPMFKQAAIEASEKEARREFLLENPGNIEEKDFSYELLDSVFWSKFGPINGERKLTLAGIEVAKSVSVHKSNSGKSSDTAVAILWTGSDGQKHSEGTESIYKGNRRSDPDRNWGLGRE
ncbi:MAG: hypothetical protein P4N59_03950 [Negativicutes bacterium]|nr:hypothetical protein [Negativicutes bacterium]